MLRGESVIKKRIIFNVIIELVISSSICRVPQVMHYYMLMLRFC